MIKIYLSEYAKSKQMMEDNIGNRVDVILEHLIKLIAMPDSDCRNHWMGEIAGQLNKVRKLKNKNKYPTKTQLFNWTYEYAIDDINDLTWITNEISNIEYEYDISVSISSQDISNRLDVVCYEYFLWLCDILSTYGSVSNVNIYKKLEELV